MGNIFSSKSEDEEEGKNNSQSNPRTPLRGSTYSSRKSTPHSNQSSQNSTPNSSFWRTSPFVQDADYVLFHKPDNQDTITLEDLIK